MKISPLGWARSTGTLAANLETRLGEEAEGPVGHMIPVPHDGGDGADDDTGGRYSPRRPRPDGGRDGPRHRKPTTNRSASARIRRCRWARCARMRDCQCSRRAGCRSRSSLMRMGPARGKA